MTPAIRRNRGRAAAVVLAGLSLCVTAGLADSAADSAPADSCLDQVRQLAKRYDMAIDPPDAATGPRNDGIASRDLAESGGVIEPLRTGDPAVIEPPRTGTSRMPTAPAPARKPSVARAEGSGFSAGDLATLESMLVAARAEAQRGDDTGCFNRLQAAQAFADERDG